MNMTRRTALKLGLVGAAAAAAPSQIGSLFAANSAPRISSRRLPRPFSLPLKKPPAMSRTATVDGIDRYWVSQQLTTAEIIPGFRTPVFTYNGSYPGPTFDVTKGSPIHVRMANDLPNQTTPIDGNPPWTSTHLHGSATPPQWDGYADDITLPGQWKDYWYPQSQPARTIWYHDHGVHHTAETVYNGMAGFYRIHDEVEASLDIPHLTLQSDGTYNTAYPYDVPLVISDAFFARDGSFFWDDAGEDGLYGDVILVNGTPWPYMRVEPRKYRFRILVGSVSRSFEYYLDNGAPLHVIGTDGGLLPAPVSVQRIKHGMAERYEVIIDFAPFAGKRIRLLNDSPRNNGEWANTDKVMEFRVGTSVSDPTLNSIPDQLAPISEAMALTEADVTGPTRTITLGRTHGQWAINEQLWHDVVDSGYELNVGNPLVNSVEVWEVTNLSGGWFHPLHIHLIDFQILSRNGLPPAPYEMGPKDVVYMGEDETVRLLCKFGPHTGRYMMHCHNLVHEDHDMMHQFVVVDEEGGQGIDPVWGDPAKPGPMPGW